MEKAFHSTNYLRGNQLSSKAPTHLPTALQESMWKPIWMSEFLASERLLAFFPAFFLSLEEFSANEKQFRPYQSFLQKFLLSSIVHKVF